MSDEEISFPLTMDEIAEIAGVSKSTVSRALHSPQMVKAETRQRILDIAEKNKYIYNAHAADFAKKKTSIIGYIVPTIKDSIHAETIEGVQQKIQETNYSVLLGNSRYISSTEYELISVFQQKRVAGLILTGTSKEKEEFILNKKNASYPCVITWETTDNPEISYVGFDNFRAAYRMTEYLIKLGHKKISLLIGPYDKASRAKKRLGGFLSALEDYEISYKPPIIMAKEPTLLDGKEAMFHILSQQELPTAVFAASDALAVGALSAIKSRNLVVPDDISLAGFDDIDIASYSDPPLTTVKVPAYEMGQLAVEVILEMIENHNSRKLKYCLDTDLIIRGSVSPPKM